MGVPHRDPEDTLPDAAGDVADSGHDSQACGAVNGGEQSELGQSTEAQSGQPAAEEAKRLPEEEAKKPTTDESSGRLQEEKCRGSLSVTVLTLDAGSELRPLSRGQQLLHTPRAGENPRIGDRENDMSDLKLIRDFQVRRKYGRRPGHVPPGSTREKNFIDLGLSGTRYFGSGSGSSTASYHNNSSSSSIGSGGGGREINIAVLGSKGVGKSGEYDDGHHGDSEQDVNY